MSRDLDLQLQEMGGEYREVVDRLRGAFAPHESAGTASLGRAASEGRPARIAGWTLGYLIAASLLVVCGLAVVLRGGMARSGKPEAPRAASEYTLAFARNESAVRAMIASQNADGSWKNDFLTRQNAAALRSSDLPEARVAYKKAVRNLRVKGML